MFERLKRFLMVEADGSPGGGAKPPAASSSAPAPAQGAATPPVDLKAFEAEVAERARNATFAELRRSGKLTKKEVKELTQSPGAPTNEQQPKPQKTSTPKVEKSLTDSRAYQMGKFNYELEQAGFKPQGKAYERMAAAYLSEKPTDGVAWMKDYTSGLGVASNPATPNPAQPRAANERPASDAGSPHAVPAAVIQEDVLAMSESQVVALQQRLMAQHGTMGGLRKYNELLRASTRARGRFKLTG